MLLQKYHLLIFREREGACRDFRMRGWFPFLFIFLFLVLVAGNVYFVQFYFKYIQARNALQVADANIELQSDLLLAEVHRLKKAEQSYRTMISFNAKLGIMLSLDTERASEDTDEEGLIGRPLVDEHFFFQTRRGVVRNMHNIIKDIDTSLFLEEVFQQTIIGNISVQRDAFTRVPSIWPVRGPISSGFGPRGGEFHKGVDILAPTGAPIISPASGIVTFMEPYAGYGLMVEVTHGGGVVTRFAHCSAFVATLGQKVNRGTIIALVGATGRVTAPHLHYEVHVKGVAVNPVNYLLN